MAPWWQHRPVTTRLPDVRLPGRVLVLADDAHAIRRQLAGENLPLPPSGPLRNDLSTDEIAPARICYHVDETLGRFPYTGLTTQEAQPIGCDAVRAGGFVASIAGRRRGKGSSREAAPLAELAAGIRLVAAESFERIYEANCINLGLLTTTDFDLVADLHRGGVVPLDAFTHGLDPIAAEVVRRGGLFPFNVARLNGQVDLPPPAAGPRPMTLAEKILASHWRSLHGPTPGVQPGDSGFVSVDLRFSHEYVTPMSAAFWDRHVGPGIAVTDPDSVVLFRDHLALLDAVLDDPETLRLVRALAETQREFAARNRVRLHDGVEGRAEGICHTLILERYAEPGSIVLGTDSHTCQAGAVGALAIGCGATEMFNAWFTCDVRVLVPATVRVHLDGHLGADLTAKDAMLLLLADPFIRAGGAVGAVLEFAGDAVSRLSLDERATLTNMAAEVGAFTGIVAADDEVVRLLVDRGCPPDRAQVLVARARPDEGCEIAHTLRLSLAELEPMAATPGDPGNGRPVRELGRTPVDLAYVGSCTGGKRSDMDVAAGVLSWARRHGAGVSPRVRCFIQCGSDDVWQHCRSRGYLGEFATAGVSVLPPGCGACINAGPGVSTRPDQVTVASINRNFPGRSGPGRVYLTSTATVMASAIAGRLVSWPMLRKELEQRPADMSPSIATE